MKGRLALTLLLVALTPLYANAGEDNQQDQKAEIKIKTEGRLPLEQLQGKNVLVSFKGSDKLTEVLAKRVTDLGAHPVEAAGNADLILEAEGQFSAVRPFGNRQAHASIGEVFEKAGEVETKNKSLNIVLAHGGPMMTAGQATIVANFANMVGEATGVKGWFNSLVAGDPDGFCFKGCEYKQDATIKVEIRPREGQSLGTMTVVAATEHKKLKPLEVIDAALQTTMNAFREEPKTEESKTAAADQTANQQ